jgi:hypothetical protein
LGDDGRPVSCVCVRHHLHVHGLRVGDTTYTPLMALAAGTGGGFARPAEGMIDDHTQRSAATGAGALRRGYGVGWGDGDLPVGHFWLE